MDHLSVAMKKSGVDDKLIDFFPPNQRDSDSLAKHFENVGLKGVVEFHSKKTQASIREQIINGIKELIQQGKPVAETIKYIKQEIATQKWTDTDAVSIAWSGLIHSVDWGNKADQVELYLNKQLSVSNIMYLLSYDYCYQYYYYYYLQPFTNTLNSCILDSIIYLFICFIVNIFCRHITSY